MNAEQPAGVDRGTKVGPAGENAFLAVAADDRAARGPAGKHAQPGAWETDAAVALYEGRDDEPAGGHQD
jgi:hypothetical protein